MSRHRTTLALAVAGSLAGCAAADTDRAPRREAAATPAPTPRPFRVALLSPGPISDAGWNAAAYEGLLAIEKEMGATIAQIETRTPPEFEAGFAEYASQGFDLVFGHGFEFQDAAAKVGAEFPNTTFITTSGSTVRANVAPMVFRLEEATYLLGMLAALSSRTGITGVVGGVEIPSVASTFLAYAAGAHAVKPEMTIKTAYIGSWDDVSAAKEATLAQVRQGADFIFHNADAAGFGVFRAVEESTRSDLPVYAFGANKDQASVAPRVVLASAVLDIPRAFLEVAAEVKAGTFKPRIVEMGMRQGIVSLVFNPALDGVIGADVRARIEAERAKIVTGERQVPKGF